MLAQPGALSAWKAAFRSLCNKLLYHVLTEDISELDAAYQFIKALLNPYDFRFRRNMHDRFWYRNINNNRNVFTDAFSAFETGCCTTWAQIGDTAFRIPKPYELGGIGTLAERGLEQFSDDSVESKVFFSRMGQYLMDTLSLDPTPQAIKPLWNVINNRDSFTGTPIETPGMERFTKD